MAERTRTCPQCGGAMLVRLGEFQCQQCDHTLPLAAAEEPQPGSGGSSGYSPPAYGTRSGSEARPGTYSSIGSSLGAADGAGTSKLPPAQPPPGQHDPGAQYRNAPPPAPGSSGYLLTGASDMYGVGGPTARVRDSLDTEKGIYLGLVALGGLIQVIFFFAAGPSAGVGMGPGIGALLGSAIAVALYYWVFFGEEMWGKYACLGCSGLNLISAIGFLFSGGATLRALPQLQGTDSAAIQSFITVFGLIQIASVAWLLAILWRDIQRRQV